MTNSGSNYVVTTVGSQATATVGISGTDVGNGGTATAATSLQAMHILLKLLVKNSPLSLAQTVIQMISPVFQSK